jgi:hypothetical protein
MVDQRSPSEQTEQMFAAVGRAITQWSFVEKDLSVLLGVCIGNAILDEKHGAISYNVWTAMWLFYSIENWRAKLQLVDAAMEAHLKRTSVEEEIGAEWGRLSGKANKLAGKRNKLAHWFVLPAQRTGTGAEGEPIAPARLCPPYGSPGYYQATGLNPSGVTLTEVEVRHIEAALCLLSDKIRAFTRKVAAVKELRDRDARRAFDLLQLDGRLDPLLVEALRRALPPEA